MKLPIGAVAALSFALVGGAAACTKRAGQAPVPDSTPVAAVEAPAPEAAPAPADATPVAAGGDHPAVLAPAPLARADRLQPCRVDLVYTFRDVEVSDDTFRTVKLTVPRLVRDFAAGTTEIDWLTAPVAPIPLTAAQARAHAAATPGAGAGSVILPLGELVFTYGFDAQGRTYRVTMDVVADSSVYIFHYIYLCGVDDAGPPAPPAWADDVP